MVKYSNSKRGNGHSSSQKQTRCCISSCYFKANLSTPHDHSIRESRPRILENNPRSSEKQEKSVGQSAFVCLLTFAKPKSTNPIHDGVLPRKTPQTKDLQDIERIRLTVSFSQRWAFTTSRKFEFNQLNIGANGSWIKIKPSWAFKKARCSKI